MTVAASSRVYFLPMLALALLLRLVVVTIVLFRYPHDWLFSKAPDLGFLACSLSTGHGLASPFGGSTGYSAFVAPGYPWLLAVLFRIFGSYSYASGAAIIGCQTLFALLTVWLLMDVARRVLSARAANLAGFLWAASPPLLWLPVILWETSLSILLLTGMTALALRGTRRGGTRYWAVAGGYCGLAMLVNPSLTVALCSLLAWTACHPRLAQQGGRWLCLLALLAVFAPWPLRNALVLHAFVPLRSNFGYELWQGNHPGGDGLFDASLEPLRNREEYAGYAAVGEMPYMRRKTSAALNYISAHRLAFGVRSAERFLRFWSGAGARDNSLLIEADATAVSLLGLAGGFLLFRQSRSAASLFLLPILLFPLPYYVTHPDFRFRLVIDPLLTILSAHALLCVHQQLRGRSRV